MHQGEHSAILLTCIELPFVIKNFVLSIFEWPFYTGFTVNPSVVLSIGKCEKLKFVTLNNTPGRIPQSVMCLAIDLSLLIQGL